MEINIPNGMLSSADDKKSAERRKKIREALFSGQAVIVEGGEIKDKKEVTNKDKKNMIMIPPGKLASSFYWYERDPDLLEGEKEAMRRSFPQFRLSKLDDGRLCWEGEVKNVIGENSKWFLQVIYDHNHPNNSSYGGSIKVYSIYPDLNQVAKELGETIPHLLKDSEGYFYICTANPEDFKIGNKVTTAASALTWAIKWIGAFELWLAGTLSTEKFSGHNI